MAIAMSVRSTNQKPSCPCWLVAKMGEGEESRSAWEKILNLPFHITRKAVKALILFPSITSYFAVFDKPDHGRKPEAAT